MLYVFCTITGTTEKIHVKIDTHIDHSHLLCCIVPPQKQCELVHKQLFFFYVFVNTVHIDEFSKCMCRLPEKKIVLKTGCVNYSIYEVEEYFLTNLLKSQNVIDLPREYKDGDFMKVIFSPLCGFGKIIKKVIWRQRLVVFQMNLIYRAIDAFLGLDRIASFAG